ncbi:MAG TPA: FAD-dependent oxidoreductase [Gammaproteobacteria bacterium]|nr:FAD-dependent oxidoreductase [Gammaproteobacteria bacterium]
MSAPELSTKTQVCIIGAGPAGVIAAYLFSLRGVPVVLLEGENNFDREFRGDTFHASSLEVLDQLGFADDVVKLCNSKVGQLNFKTSEYSIQVADFAGMKSKFPFVGIIPQVKFLNYMVRKAGALPDFNIIMRAKVKELKQVNGKNSGVKYKKDGEEFEVDSLLTIGADGRGSTARRLANIKLGKTSPPMDVLWFRVAIPKDAELQESVDIRVGSGSMVVMVNRGDYIQCGYIIMKGSYKELRNEGIEHFQNEIISLAPELSSTISEVSDWKQCAILSVVTGSVEKWYQEGLLLIGDAAHIMSPVGGVGINYAIQDAVATVNILADAIKEERLSTDDLAKVQSRREPAVKFIQGFQLFAQKRIISSALKSDKPFSPPLPLRIVSKISFMRKRIAKFLAYGKCPERVEGL